MNMQIQGEADIVYEGKDDKIGDNGIDLMFVRYSLNREEDSYRMWNNKINRAGTLQGQSFSI